MKNQLNLNKEKLEKEQSFTLIYDGPTFENGIKLNKFIGNLESLKELIYNIADINLRYNEGYNKKEDIQIKIVPRSGSIEEEIILILSKPELRDAIFSVIVGLFFYLLSRKDTKNDTQKQDKKLDNIKEKLEELIVRDQSKNIENLYGPLEKTNDKLILNENNETKLEIEFSEKIILENSLKEIKEKLKVEEKIEELEGRISMVNIDTDYLKFHVLGMEHSYPLYSNLQISQLIPLIAVPIKAKLKVRRIKDKIKNFHLIEYKKLQQVLSDGQN